MVLQSRVANPPISKDVSSNLIWTPTNNAESLFWVFVFLFIGKAPAFYENFEDSRCFEIFDLVLKIMITILMIVLHNTVPLR